MFRATFVSLTLAGMGLMAAPHGADAQVSVQVGLYWEFGDDGWRSYSPTYDSRSARVYAAPREVVYYTPRQTVRVPPGHMPRPGYCRLWYPGRPPGHQPRARPCEQLFRYHGYDGAVIIGMPDYRSDQWIADYQYFDNDYDDDRPGRWVVYDKKGRPVDNDRPGRCRGRGRGGR
jgi:hypothetical protein